MQIVTVARLVININDPITMHTNIVMKSANASNKTAAVICNILSIFCVIVQCSDSDNNNNNVVRDSRQCHFCYCVIPCIKATCEPEITMAAAAPRWLNIVIATLRELEPTIPYLPERMTVRMLRMILENGMAEVDLEAPPEVQWENSIHIFDFMRNCIRVLSLADPGSNSARLCCAISDGMSVVNSNDGSVQTPSEIIHLNNTDTEKIGFMVCIYQRISDELMVLVRDDSYMECMGPEGRVKFTEIISLMQMMVDMGTKYINDVLEHEPVAEEEEGHHHHASSTSEEESVAMTMMIG